MENQEEALGLCSELNSSIHLAQHTKTPKDGKRCASENPGVYVPFMRRVRPALL